MTDDAMEAANEGDKITNKNQQKIYELIDELRTLRLPVDEFAVFGSGPMAIRGLKEPGDLDIIVTNRLWTTLLVDHQIIDRETYHLIQIENIDFFEDTYPERDIDRLICTADVIDDIRYVSLDEILSWKRQRNLDKDKIDIQLIESYLQKISISL
jgi:hypothetical protein